MKINKQLAQGVHIVGDDYEYVEAVRKPNADTKIIKQVWVVGKAKDFKKLNKKEVK